MKKIVYRRKLMALVCGLMMGSLLLPNTAFAQRAGGGNAAQQQQQREEQERQDRERQDRERREREDRERKEREDRERHERERQQQRQALKVQMPAGNWLIQSLQLSGNDGYWDLDGPAYVPGTLIQINDGSKERLYGNVFTFVAVSAREPGWYYIRDGQGHGVGVPGNKNADGVNLMIFDVSNTAFQQFRVEWNDAGNAFRLYTRAGKPVAVENNRNATLIQTTSRAQNNQLWWRLVSVGSSRRTSHSRW